MPRGTTPGRTSRALSAHDARRLLESTRIVAWRAPADRSQFLYVAPQARDLLGYPLDAWYERHFWRTHVHPADLARMRTVAPGDVADGSTVENEYRMRAADGGLRRLHEVAAFVRTSDGTLALEGFLLEVSRPAPAEDDDWLRLEVHDLVQPLSAILANAQAASNLLEQGKLSAVDLRQILDDIIADVKQAANRLAGLPSRRPLDAARRPAARA